MKLISSTLTFFLKKIVPIILTVNIFVTIFLLILSIVTFKQISFLIYVSIIFGIAWFDSFRKIEEVFLSDKFFIVENEKIAFNEIISFEKKVLTKLYKVRYQKGQVIKSFVFRPNFVILFEPKYFKEIKKSIKKMNK